MAEKLAEQVRRKLRVTWSDPETDARIESDIIPSAEALLRLKLGIPDGEEFDFSKPGIENALFLNLCFYEWNDALDDFDANYETQIAQARRKWMVKQYVEEQESSADV